MENETDFQKADKYEKLAFQCKNCGIKIYFEREVIKVIIRNGLQFYCNDGHFYCHYCKKRIWRENLKNIQYKTPDQKNYERAERRRNHLKKIKYGKVYRNRKGYENEIEKEKIKASES